MSYIIGHVVYKLSKLKGTIFSSHLSYLIWNCIINKCLYYRVHYALHFEFVTSVSGVEEQEVPEEGGGSEWQGPAKVDIETLVWDLPVTIHPTFPTHAALHSSMQTSLTEQL